MARCAQIPEFIEQECSLESGRIVGLAFIHKDIAAAIYADPSNAANWVDGDYAQDLYVFQEVRGSYTGGSPTEINGVGSQSTKVINAEHALTVFIQGVKGNEDFFNEIVKTDNYRVAFVVGGDYGLLYINNVDTSIFGTAPVEEGLDTEVGWTVTVKWRDVKNPRTSNVPTGIFN